jgi:hypothetical protein
MLMLMSMAPRIEFRLHRTRSVYITVQNRYLEQVVVGTGNLSAPHFYFLVEAKKTLRHATFGYLVAPA